MRCLNVDEYWIIWFFLFILLLEITRLGQLLLLALGGHSLLFNQHSIILDLLLVFLFLTPPMRMRLVGCGVAKLYRQRLQRWHQLFILWNIKQGCRILQIVGMPKHFSAILLEIRILILLLLIVHIGLLQYLLCNQGLGLDTSFLILSLNLSTFAHNIGSLELFLSVLHGTLSNLWLNGAPYHLILLNLVVDLLDFVLWGMIQRNQVVLLRL